jgi:hypothetical protein
MERNKQQELCVGGSRVRRRRAVGDTRGDLKHDSNKGKKNHSTPSGYHDGRDSGRVVKRRDHRENKGRRRRRAYKSLGHRSEKTKERRSSSLCR